MEPALFRTRTQGTIASKEPGKGLSLLVRKVRVGGKEWKGSHILMVGRYRMARKVGILCIR